MNISDEMLMAYIDGEVDEATRTRIAAAIASDPALAEKARRQRQLQAQLRAAFDPVLTEPIPESLRVTSGAIVRDLTAARTVKAKRFAQVQWLPIAASVAFGVGLGFLIAARVDRDQWMAADASASGELARALSEQLASRPDTDSPARIGISYRAQSGEYCRTFVMNTAVAGVACLEGATSRWQIRLMTPARPSSDGGMRTAGGEMPPAVLEFIARDMQGEPLDAEDEARVAAAQWR